MREEMVIEDDAPDGALLTAAEAMEQHIIRPGCAPGYDRETDPRPPSIWQLRRQQTLTNGRDFVRTMLRFGIVDDDERADGRAEGEGHSVGEVEESDEEEPTEDIVVVTHTFLTSPLSLRCVATSLFLSIHYKSTSRKVHS